VANRARHDDDQVHLVTSARRAHSEELSERTRRYLISMAIRTVCVVLAIFVVHGPLRLVAIAAAVILPWLAVVVANAGPVDDEEQPEFVEASRPQIEGGATIDIADASVAEDAERRPESETMAARHHGAS